MSDFSSKSNTSSCEEPNYYNLSSFLSENSEFKRDKFDYSFMNDPNKLANLSFNGYEYPIRNEPNKSIIDEYEGLFRNDTNRPTNFSSKNEDENLSKETFSNILTKNNIFRINDENILQTFHFDIDKENSIDKNISLSKNSVKEENREINNYLKKKRYNAKFKSDNLIRKVKHILLDNILHFINYKIDEIYGHNIIFGKLKNLSQKERSEGNIEYNKLFLNKTLGEICSSKITGRITNFLSNYNEKIVKNLLEEKDLNKRNYFKNLFNLTFIQSLDHFNGTKLFKELNGMKRMIDEVKNECKDDLDYENNLKYYFIHFEEIIKKKRSKKDINKKII